MANSLYPQNIDIRIHHRLSTFLRYLIFLFTTKQNIEKKIVNSIGTSIERLNESNGITENIGNELREERSPFRFRAAILDSFSFKVVVFSSVRFGTLNRTSAVQMAETWAARLSFVASRAVYYSTSPA